MRFQVRGAARIVGIFVVVCGFMAVGAVSAFALSGGLNYEMVSPIFKGGYGVNGLVAVAPDGRRVAFVSLGRFADAPSNGALTNDYVAQRKDESGWSTSPVVVPASIAPPALEGSVIDFSPTLDSALDAVVLGSNFGRVTADTAEQVFLRHPVDAPDTAPNAPDPAPNFQIIGGILKDSNKTEFRVAYGGAASDFSHVLFEGGTGPRAEQLLPEAVASEAHLYDLTSGLPCAGLSKGVCNEIGDDSGSTLRLVGLNNRNRAISPSCRQSLGGVTHFNDMSADGSEIFFSAEADETCTASQLFVRLGGERTVEISRPLSSACTEVPC